MKARLLPFALALLLAGPSLAEGKREDDITRVLLVGDSFVALDVGATLEAQLGKDPSLSVARRGKSATGLARPDYFDWWAEARRMIDKHRPQVVVVMMGGNDGQDLLDRRRRGRVRWDTPAWAEAYRERMRSFLESLGAPDRQFIWLELPPMEGPRLERKVAFIRKVQRELVAELPSATYLETHGLLREGGQWLREVPDGRGGVAPLRDPDGVHFTLAGGKYFGERLALELKRHLRRAPRAELPAGAGSR